MTEHDVGMRGEMEEQVELLTRHRDLVAAHEDLAAIAMGSRSPVPTVEVRGALAVPRVCPAWRLRHAPPARARRRTMT